jgi:hypothetical protein
MRKFLMPLLMASVLIPAAALAEPGDRGVRAHGERFERSEKSDSSSSDRPQRAERSSSDAPRVERVERSNSDTPRVRIDRSERSARVEPNVEVPAGEPVRVRRGEREQIVQPVQPVQPVQVERRRGGNNDGFVGAIQRAGRDESARQRGDVVVHRDRDRNRDGDHRWNGDRNGNHRWSGDWRRDNRYDWHSYRNRYQSLFRLGRYYDPYGWNYRRFSIGFNLWPSYYGSSNWLNDPWQYRLPPAYGPYRWVRYYDDALLVNIYDGQVVDVIYNFFW